MYNFRNINAEKYDIMCNLHLVNVEGISISLSLVVLFHFSFHAEFRNDQVFTLFC